MNVFSNAMIYHCFQTLKNSIHTSVPVYWNDTSEANVSALIPPCSAFQSLICIQNKHCGLKVMAYTL